jgi:hypothetical protein
MPERKSASNNDDEEEIMPFLSPRPDCKHFDFASADKERKDTDEVSFSDDGRLYKDDDVYLATLMINIYVLGEVLNSVLVKYGTNEMEMNTIDILLVRSLIKTAVCVLILK